MSGMGVDKTWTPTSGPHSGPHSGVRAKSFGLLPWFQRRFMEGARSEAGERKNRLW